MDESDRYLLDYLRSYRSAYPPYKYGIDYVYVFSVPLFFVISGFLNGKAESDAVFWKKTWQSLLLPMLIICVVNLMIQSVEDYRHGIFRVSDFLKGLLYVVIGNHSNGRGYGLVVCWFIYTLAVLKLMVRYIPRWVLCYVLMPVSACIFIVMTDNDMFDHSKNAILISLLCLPFFIFGRMMKDRYASMEPYLKSRKTVLPVFTFSLFLLVLVGYYNGPAWLYLCQYGKDYMLYLCGGVSGTIIVFILSGYLSFMDGKILRVLSSGTIIILGFHTHLIYVVKRLLPEMSGWGYYGVSLVILFCFYPIILLTARYVPVLLGRRKCGM